MSDEIPRYPSTDIPALLGRPLNDIQKTNAPDILYYRGAIKPPLSGPRVSVIGTRKPSTKGLANARQIAEILVKNSVTIVGGLAKGIDTAAHTAAMQQRGGKTVGVIGTPLNRTYPPENMRLQQDMMNTQLVLTQFPVGHQTAKKDFVLRNHTMALISDCTIIIEAADDSGTLYQGRETLRLGKPLFICKSMLQQQPDEQLAWPEKMIKHGAIPLDDPMHILEMFESGEI